MLKLLLVLALAASPTPPVPLEYAAEVPGPLPPWSRDRAILGKRLFFDPRLSLNNDLSCASCHVPEHAFAEPRRVSKGIDGKEGDRNAPAVLNRLLSTAQFWDGRSATLEEQALGPIENPVEMGLPLDEAIKRLSSDPYYARAFHKVFNGPPSKQRLADAIAAYERTIFSVKSPFDRFIAGDKAALSESARRGLELFGDKARCSVCHVGPNFSDEIFHVLGWGNGKDPGRSKVTAKPADMASFKTPTLREIARTAPYMHDGTLATLGEVIDLYDRGGNPAPNLDKQMGKLGLTPRQKADLLAFLNSLSGEVIDFEGPIRQASEKAP